MSTGLSPAAKKQADVKRALRTMLEKGAQEFKAVLPEHLTPERLIRVAMTACTVQPKLLDCSQESVALALLSASQCGLEPDGYHAHLVPYGRTCQFIPDFKGLIQLALDNDVVIDAYAVREKDKFEYQLGTNPAIVHVPTEESDPGPLRCAYAVATFANGRSKFVVATRADIEKRRDSSKASGPDSPWKKWEAEMWIKTAVKMLMKFVPRSQRMKAALVHDDMAEMGLQQNPRTIDTGPKQLPGMRIDKASSVADRLGRQVADDVGEMPIEDVSVGSQISSQFSLDDFQKFLQFTTTVADVDELFQTMVAARKEEVSIDDYEKAYDLCQIRSRQLAG